MIELPPLGGQGSALWSGLLDVAECMSHDWTLIGGQMVLLHALERGRIAPRVSEDLDVVIDARVRPPALARMMQTLEDLGFTSTGASPDGVAHRFERGGVLVDVLAPDGLGERTKLETVGRGVTIAVAGGTYALSESSPVEVTYEGRAGLVPRPSLAGALLVKACAAISDHGPKGPARHLRDLAFLTTLVDDAFALHDHLGTSNRRRLRAVKALADEGHEAWALLGDDRQDGHATWRVIAELV